MSEQRNSRVTMQSPTEKGGKAGEEAVAAPNPFEFDIAKFDELFEHRTLDVLAGLGGTEKLVKGLLTDVHAGLSHSDALNEERKRIFGRNVLPVVEQESIFKLMLGALQDKTLILLSVVSLLALAIGLYQDFRPGADPSEPKIHWVDGVAIIITVVIVVLVASINDYQKEKQFRKLNAKKEDRLVKVVRDSQPRQISIFDVLVGDIMMLEPGDVVNVDGILIECMNLRMDESSATGESDTIKKSLNSDPFILSGSKVTEGIGKYLVVAVGEHSFFGKTLMALRTEDEDTPLQIKLGQLAEQIAKIGTSAAIVMVIALLLKYIIGTATGAGFGSGPGQEDATLIVAQIIAIFISAITIVVVAVPEGLPLAVTLALAYATKRMLRDNNLVRVISACETMGGATTVCSDKTGTLTQNKMTVVKGVIGKTIEFEGDSEIDLVDQKLRHESSKKNALVFYNTMLEGVCVNSSAYEEKNESNGQTVFVGSKTEVALLEYAKKCRVNYGDIREAKYFKLEQIYPFSSERKYMATMIKLDVGGKPTYRLHVKGASEIILRACTQAVYTDGDAKIVPLTPVLFKEYTALIDQFAELTLRTICLAYRDLSESEFKKWLNGPIREKILEARKEEKKQAAQAKNTVAEDDGLLIRDPESLPVYSEEKKKSTSINEELTDADVLSHPLALADLASHLVCLGIVGIEDPLRPGVPEAVAACQKAGVIVRMVTGDNILTAKSIASKCGIFKKGGIVMEGAAFRKLPQEEMDAIIPRLQVLARSSPTDKQLLVGRLKALGETVAVTGDGTNDGPALKMADIGFSMGIAGTEVAKEASSIILMDDNFASIVKAMMWGRAVNDAVKKFLQFQLTVNVTAVTLTFISSLVDSSESSVLTAVQLLWVNLIMDSLAALALATEAPTLEVLNRPPENKQSPLITVNMWKMIVGQAILQVSLGLGLLFGGPTLFQFNELRAAGGVMSVKKGDKTLAGEQRNILKTIIFNMFVFLQLFNMINCRNLDSNINVFKGIHKNRFFYIVIAIILGGQLLIIFFAGVVFKTVPLEAKYWGACVGFGVISLPWGVVIRLMPNGIFKKIFGNGSYKRVVPQSESSLEAGPGATDPYKPEMRVFKAVRGSARLSWHRGSKANLEGSRTSLNKAKTISEAKLGSAAGSMSALAGELAGYGFVTEPVKMTDKAVPKHLATGKSLEKINSSRNDLAGPQKQSFNEFMVKSQDKMNELSGDTKPKHSVIDMAAQKELAIDIKDEEDATEEVKKE